MPINLVTVYVSTKSLEIKLKICVYVRLPIYTCKNLYQIRIVILKSILTQFMGPNGKKRTPPMTFHEVLKLRIWYYLK